MLIMLLLFVYVGVTWWLWWLFVGDGVVCAIVNILSLLLVVIVVYVVLCIGGVLMDLYC